MQVQVEPELGLLVDIVYSKAPTLQRHGQFSDFFGKYLLLNTAALKGNKCGLQKTMGFSGKNLKIFGNHVVPRTGRRWITWCPGPWDMLLGLDIVHMGGFLNGCQKPVGFITQMVQ